MAGERLTPAAVPFLGAAVDERSGEVTGRRADVTNLCPSRQPAIVNPLGEVLSERVVQGLRWLGTRSGTNDGKSGDPWVSMCIRS